MEISLINNTYKCVIDNKPSLLNMKEKVNEKDILIKKLEEKVKKLEFDNSNLIVHLRNPK